MTTKQPEAPTKERIRELFEYRDGHLINKTIRKSQIMIGERAGGIDYRGYIKIRVDGRMCREHQLIFLYFHGYIPRIIDHIDCNKANNKIENLRAATKSENGMNRTGSYSQTGFRNVYRKGETYQVQMTRNGIIHHIGTFSLIDKAVSAAEAARRNIFGEFA